MDKDNVHVHYHDQEYGFPIEDDNQLFARLILEINQAGLSSQTTIHKKKDNCLFAYDQFDIARVAADGQRDIDRLRNDPGIIRNRLKVAAAIENARRTSNRSKRIWLFQKENGWIHSILRARKNG